MEREYTSPRDFCLPRAIREPPHRTPPRDEDNAARKHSPAATRPGREPSPGSAPIFRASIVAPRAAVLPYKDAAARAALPPPALLPRCVPHTSPQCAPQLAPLLP